MDILHGDCLNVMPTLGAESIDACVTDPPYGLSFMGKNWDHGVPGVAFWREVFRVLKPGAHLVAFGGTRTFHRLVCAIEDAGFEIRDQGAWLTGQGFPKSLDVSKAIDKAAGAADPECAPATPAAQQWSGWGTALKPAHEPLCFARKPLIGTVAENVLRYGTGALNVDGCRVGTDGGTTRSGQEPYGESGWRTGHSVIALSAGRWPANVMHDGSPEVLAVLDDAARFFYSPKASKRDRDEGVVARNVHPTVKPTDLMRWLCRLVTPPGGVVLDPFTGSGSTGKAAVLEGFRFIGIEREAEYVEIARARIAAAQASAPLLTAAE